MRCREFSDDSLKSPVGLLQLEFQIPQSEIPLQREVERFPYVPSDPAARDERCREAYNIQVQGLTKRIDATGIKKVVIGVRE